MEVITALKNIEFVSIGFAHVFGQFSLIPQLLSSIVRLDEHQ